MKCVNLLEVSASMKCHDIDFNWYLCWLPTNPFSSVNIWKSKDKIESIYPSNFNELIVNELIVNY